MGSTLGVADRPALLCVVCATIRAAWALGRGCLTGVGGRGEICEGGVEKSSFCGRSSKSGELESWTLLVAATASPLSGERTLLAVAGAVAGGLAEGVGGVVLVVAALHGFSSELGEVDTSLSRFSRQRGVYTASESCFFPGRSCELGEVSATLPRFLPVRGASTASIWSMSRVAANASSVRSLSLAVVRTP